MFSTSPLSSSSSPSSTPLLSSSISNANEVLELWENDHKFRNHVGPSINHIITYINNHNLTFTTKKVKVTMPFEIIQLIISKYQKGHIDYHDFVSATNEIEKTHDFKLRYEYPLMYHVYVNNQDDIRTIYIWAGLEKFLDFLKFYNISLKNLDIKQTTSLVIRLLNYKVDFKKYEEVGLELVRDDKPTVILEKLRNESYFVLYAHTRNELYKPSTNVIMNKYIRDSYLSIESILDSLNFIIDNGIEWNEPTNPLSEIFYNNTIKYTWIDLAYKLYFDPETIHKLKKYNNKTKMGALVYFNRTEVIKRFLYDFLRKYKIPLEDTIVDNYGMTIIGFLIESHFSEAFINLINSLYETPVIPAPVIPAKHNEFIDYVISILDEFTPDAQEKLKTRFTEILQNEFDLKDYRFFNE